MANFLKTWMAVDRLGIAETEGQVTTANFNAAWVPGTSGGALGISFNCLTTVSGGDVSIWMWIRNPTGAGTILGRADMFLASTSQWELDQSAGTVITNGQSANVTITTPGWYEFKWTNVTLARQPHQVWFYNNSSAPTDDHWGTIAEGGLDPGLSHFRTQLIQDETTTGGNNMQAGNINAPVVIQLNTDTANITTWGWPTVKVNSPVSDADAKGMRFKVSAVQKIWGARIAGWNDPDALACVLYEGTTEVARMTKQFDFTITSPIAPFDDGPYTLKINQRYDIMIVGSGGSFNDVNSSTGNGGEASEHAMPAAVKLAFPHGGSDNFQWRWINGSNSAQAADTLTEDTARWPTIELMLAEVPAATGGGGGAAHLVDGGLVQ